MIVEYDGTSLPLAQCLRMQVVFHLATMIETARKYLPNELLMLLCELLAQKPYRKSAFDQ